MNKCGKVPFHKKDGQIFMGGRGSMKKVKQMLSMVLVCCVVVGVLPTFALAAEQASFQGHTYQVFDESLTWENAKAVCEAKGGHLATVTSIEEQEFIAQLIEDGEKDYYWLGATGEDGAESWTWVTGESWIYENWGEGEPNHYRNECYLGILKTRQQWDNRWHEESTWNDFSTRDVASMGYVCEWDDSIYEDLQSRNAQVDFNGHTYQIYDGVCSTWQEAKEYCESLGGHLATITSQAENDFLYSYIVSKGVKSAYFGFTDEAEESTWTWVTGEPVSYTNWHINEPNHENSNEDYAMFYWKYTDGTWNDGDFANKTVSGGRAFICEWDGKQADGEFRFASNTTMNCIAKNSTVDIYAGYYVDDVLTSRNYQAVVGDADILQVKNNGWDSLHGQHFSLTAKKTGSTTLTVTDPSTGVTGLLNLNVVDSEAVFSFDNVPQMTIEEGKTTNFYNYSGMVVDDFKYKEVKAADGSVDHYAVTMTVYNTLDLYGAITAYDADGNIYDYCVIDKFTSMDSSFVDSVESLIKSTGDLFYLLGNDKCYSGESISKKTEIKSSSPINVPAGGYLEISNNVSSPIALFANMAGITIDFMATTGSLASSAGKLIDAKGVIVDQLLIDAFTKDYAGEQAVKAIKKLAKQELKNGNWSLDTFGDGIQSLLKVLEQSDIDFMELLQKEIASVKGLASIAESVGMDIIPTGQLIKLLYGFSDVGELIIEATAFNKSVNYPMGIYLYTSAFSDVSTKAYYSDPVQWALMNDITSGTSATTFSPDASCTRAQAVTFLWRAAGSPEPSSTKNPFTDVKADTYYYDAVLWAVEQGITSGTTSTTFSPDAVCDRGQIVTFLYRANGSPAASGNTFSDVSSNAYYSSAVKWAVAEGVTSGTSNTTFSPNANCTRGQIVTFLYRAEN